MVQKGTIVSVLPGGVRVKPSGNDAVTPIIKTEMTLAINDIVAFVLFEDGTGIILQKM